MNASPDTYRGRFGYHVCDFATWQKLKALKKWYWQTVKDFHRWWRWQRKRPENRRRTEHCSVLPGGGAEPSFCPVFVLDQPWFKPRRVHGQDAVRYYPKTLVDHGILELFAAAAQPQAEPPTPLDDSRLRLIGRLYAAAAEWFGS